MRTLNNLQWPGGILAFLIIFSYQKMYSLLLKFATEIEHLRALQNGVLYCRPIKYFFKIEDGNVRGDKWEAVYKSQFIGEATIRVREADNPNAQWKNMDSDNVQTRVSNPNALGNLFCMSRIQIFPTATITTIYLDETLRGFGRYYLLVTNQNEFFRRIREAISKQKITAEAHQIEYLDLGRHTGDKTLFQKDQQYSWQQEFRIFFRTELAEDFQFTIGPIGDISEIYDWDKNQGFEIIKDDHQ